MNNFYMNGYLWTILYVEPNDPMLVDRSGNRTVATTDGSTRTVYLSNDISGSFKIKVLLHELGHVAMYSFNLFESIHRMIYPEHRIDAEEWICNFLADYGSMIFSIASTALGEDGWVCVPREFENLIAV